MMQKHKISPLEALSKIQQTRPICEPNDGFMQQLELYHTMQTPLNVDEEPAYQRWLYNRKVELSVACGKAPENVRFEDEVGRGVKGLQTEGDRYDLRCRKCRQILAKSEYLVPHAPKDGSQESPAIDHSPISKLPPPPLSACSHYFLDPLSWMRPQLEQGKLDGRLECPKCKTNVGKYAWQGMRCSCGQWIVPGISLARGRIDEVKSRTGGMDRTGIRLSPPSSGRGDGKGSRDGNL
ncbi:MAG: tyrosine protein phosphatase yvh1 [Pycnora praestabilis]|nr:MAG: tyrosine protein phosphatase yvh1 [Pycnora praestabilis]